MVEPGHQRFSSHPAHDTMDSRQVFVKRTAMLQLERAHSGCEATSLFAACTLHAHPQITRGIGITTTRRVDEHLRLICRHLIEPALTTDQRAIAAQRDDHLLYAHVSQLQGHGPGIL